MAVSFQHSTISEIADFLVSQPTLEALANYHVSPAIQQHIDMLLEINGEGNLSLEERLELDKILAVASVMDLVKVKARLKLAGEA